MSSPGAHDTGAGGVLVTGSTSGIGEGLAKHFARLGRLVIIHGLDATGAERVAADIGRAGGAAHIVLGDLADPQACAQVVEASVQACDHLDLLVNNAGRNVFTGVMHSTLGDWEDAMQVDLRALWLVSKHAVPHMQPGGSIVHVASNHAFRTIPGCFPYNVAKAGVLSLTQSMALELAPLGLRVNAVCPGYIDTPINDRYFATFPDAGAERQRVVGLHPAGRLGTPQDVAHAVEFLGDPARAGFITGTHLLLDGGRSALMQDPV